MGQAVTVLHHHPVTLAERPDFTSSARSSSPAAACWISDAAKASCWRGWWRIKACWRAAWRSRPRRCAAPSRRGVSVYQGDIDEGLADYPDKAFDYVILSQTLQETRSPLQVLKEMLRVGRPRDHLVSELRALERARRDAVQRSGAEDETVPL